MPKIKILLMFSIVLALSLSLLGCGLLTSSNDDPEITAGPEGELPEWLFADHRNLSADSTDDQNDPDSLPTDDVDDDEAVAPSSTEPAPAQTTPAASQPAESVSSSAVPAWQQPGKMEFIAKMMLDDKVDRYKRLIARNDDDDDAELAVLKEDITRVAEELGVNLKSEYGITIATASITESDDWFYDMDSPSGFGD